MIVTLVQALVGVSIVASLLITAATIKAPRTFVFRESSGWIIMLILAGFILVGGQIPGCQRGSYEDSGPPYCGERYGCD